MQLIKLNNIIKGETFRYYGIIESSAENSADISAATVTVKVSKDGGVFATATNAIVKIDEGTLGYFYIDLTATEMNADVICVEISSSVSNAKEPDIILYTINAEVNPGVSNFTGVFLSLLILGIQQDYDLVDAAIAQSAHNYYGVRKSNSDYIIIKESISTGTLTYAYRSNNNGRSYTSAWSNYEGLIFAGSQTVIDQ